ncbi:hypothetical protein G7Z17_g12767 [Cylindrodendrum hubeiense]|uniref:AAA+ ATPase domain-containing protein n=1 Tax=Cylindrodendrum hubeiense TaxID=595255 RepID=A0A9P5L9Z6_9HYPO|nr:hypothetical protein G7Z17_g12767 [Cylindrodendrum hubeiense]
MADTKVETEQIIPSLPQPNLQAKPTFQDQNGDPIVAAKLSEDVSPTNANHHQAGSQQGRAPVPEVQQHIPADSEMDSVVAPSDPLLSKRLDLVAQVLAQELAKFRQANPGHMTSTIDHQIAAIRDLSVEIRLGDGKTTEKDDPEKVVCQVRRSGLDEWKKPQDDKQYVISAYYRSPAIFETAQEGKRPATGNADRQERPHRVKLGSDVLTYELENITNVTIRTQSPTLFAPPYKLLTRYHPEIVQRLSQLQDQVDQMEKELTDRSITVPSVSSKIDSAPDAESPGKSIGQATTSLTVDKETLASPEPRTGGSISGDSATKDKELNKKRKELGIRFDHLRLLKDFIETDLASYIELDEKIKTGVLEKIAFEDLWFLFQPGDVLYFKNQGHHQLCKAFAVTGGQERKRGPSKMEILNRCDPPGSRGDNQNGKDDATIMHNAARGTWSPLTIDFYTMEYDGYLVGPLDDRKQIKHYAGERNITDLPIYPLKFHKKRDEMLKDLTARGRKYCSSYGHKSYSGTTCPVNRQKSPEEVHGDVFIDFRDYYRSISNHGYWVPPHAVQWKPNLGVLQRTNPAAAEAEEDISGDIWNLCDPEVDDKASEDFLSSNQFDLELIELDLFELSGDNLHLLPHRVPAYLFRARKYVHVDIGTATEIDKSDQARDSSFKDLVIPESHRDLLVGLVKNKMTVLGDNTGPEIVDGGSTQIDIVRGKGRGLIILLHGPPGSGKTSTAETLAAYTRRPLYPITCGDLGTRADQVEKALIEHTERAQRWGCVLLLDEADVFLSRRDWRDTDHNALVSVFLRQLEYYSGILFLTTNRVGVLDEAFKSRIHVSLAYPTIKLQTTLEIWEGILNRIDRDNKTDTIKTKYDRNALLSFANRHYKNHEKSNTAWNGRQIRNAFQLAIALGHHERDKKLEAAGLTSEEAAKSGDKKWMTVRLTKDNFRSIARTARDFDDYLHATRGDDSELAKHMAIRDDGHSEEHLETSSPRARKDYGRQKQPSKLPRQAKRERSSSFLNPSRDRPRPRSSAESQTPSGSGTQKRGRGSRVEQDSSDEDDDEEDGDIFEEFSDDED